MFLHSFQYAANSPREKKKEEIIKLFFNLSLITKNVTVKSFIIFQVFWGEEKRKKLIRGHVIIIYEVFQDILNFVQ